jgi:hypothetical protein
MIYWHLLTGHFRYTTESDRFRYGYRHDFETAGCEVRPFISDPEDNEYCSQLFTPDRMCKKLHRLTLFLL